ncbi:MAG TPA: ABC transporter permease, partial [Variovorax sp.]|nr:ABC transporter permease [Variovorax sp.]
MLRFLASRLAGMLVVLAIVAVLVFVLTRAASGDPIAVMLGDQATAADIARVQVEYGLDKPLPVQFGYWLREVLQGNLGQSIFLQRPVAQALFRS